ncbi:unnamed protein product [Amoebophrya sp. A120]|nr:unnamed protein product [Amoebophrya sp. A120]|eukprot:GSA120T00005578001.1
MDEAEFESVASNEGQEGGPLTTPNVVAGELVTKEQKENLLQAFRAATQPLLAGIPSFENNDHALIRYLQARNWDLKKAEAMLQNTLSWYGKYGLPSARADVKLVAMRSACWTFLGRNTNGEPIILIRTGCWNPQDYNMEEYVKYLHFFLRNANEWVERSCQVRTVANYQQDLLFPQHMDYGDINVHYPFCRGMVVLFDMKGWGVWMTKYFGYIRQLVQSVQDHSPQMLAKAYLCNAPRIFQAAWRIISPWVDAKTRPKVCFLKVDAKAATAASQAADDFRASLAQQVQQQCNPGSGAKYRVFGIDCQTMKQAQYVFETVRNEKAKLPTARELLFDLDLQTQLPSLLGGGRVHLPIPNLPNEPDEADMDASLAPRLPPEVDAANGSEDVVDENEMTFENENNADPAVDFPVPDDTKFVAAE